jgi:hypothetical protein
MFGVATSRQNDAGKGAEPFLRTDLTENVESAQFRHHQVEQGEIHPIIGIHDVECFLTVVGERDSEGPLLELHLDDAPNVWLVVGDEYMARPRSRISHD